MPQRNCGEPWSSTAHRKNIKGNKCGMGKQNYRWQYFWQNIDMMKRMLQNIKHEEIKCKILSVIFLMNISFYSKTVKKKISIVRFILYIFLYNIRSQNYFSLSNAYFSLSNILFFNTVSCSFKESLHSKNLFMRGNFYKYTYYLSCITMKILIYHKQNRWMPKAFS